MILAKFIYKYIGVVSIDGNIFSKSNTCGGLSFRYLSIEPVAAGHVEISSWMGFNPCPVLLLTPINLQL